MFDLFLPVFYTMLQLIALITLGYFLKKKGNWSSNFFRDISIFITRVALPLYFFSKMVLTKKEDIIDGIIFPFSCILIVFGSMLLASIILRFFSINQKEKRAVTALSSFGNGGYLPLAVIEIMPVTLPALTELFGTLQPTLFIGAYLIAFSPLLWSLGNYLVSGHTHAPKLTEIITPPFIGIVFGLILTGTGLNSFVIDKSLPFFHLFNAATKVGNIVLPLIMISLGAMIANLKYHKENKKDLIFSAVFVSVFRLLLLPGLFFLAYFTILKPLQLTEAQNWILFLEMNIPAATNLSVMSHRARENEDIVAFTILVNNVLYLITFPLWLLLFINVL